MSTIRWLGPLDGPDAMPAPSLALEEPNGLLAAGGTLKPQWLLATYADGIFPWYEEGQPILWWCPNPRAVLWPDRLKVSRSLRRTLDKTRLTVSVDRAFDSVIEGCAAPRRYTESTWITSAMAQAYKELHELGWAHSFETWDGSGLVGGLYGVAIGDVFFGESMFARTSDASKIALVRAVRYLREHGFALIDCQVPSEHMTSLGAMNLPRTEFLELLGDHCPSERAPGSWATEFG